MDSILNKINTIHKDELSNYKYIEKIDIVNIEKGMYICYVNNNLILKHGYVVSIRNKSNINNLIIELNSKNNKRHWFIYTKDLYIFIKERNKDNFRDLLQSFLDNDFANLTVITKK
jgi:hypothetical protein